MEHWWDIDQISSIELGKILKHIGYASYKCLWYRHPEKDLSTGLKELRNDQHVIQFIQDVKGHSTMGLYVEHLMDTPVVVVAASESSESDVQVVEDPGEQFGNGEEEDGSDSLDEDYDGQAEEVVDREISLDDSDYDEEWEWTIALPEETINACGSQPPRGLHIEEGVEVF